MRSKTGCSVRTKSGRVFLYNPNTGAFINLSENKTTAYSEPTFTMTLKSPKNH